MRIFKLSFILLVSTFLTLGLSVSLQSIMAAWTPPTIDPPDGNVVEPLNRGATGQSKIGPMMVNEGAVVPYGFGLWGMLWLDGTKNGRKAGLVVNGDYAIDNARNMYPYHIWMTKDFYVGPDQDTRQVVIDSNRNFTSNNLTVSEWLTVNKGATIEMGATIKGALSAKQTVEVDEGLTVHKNAIVNLNLTTGQNLYVQGGADITGTLTARGNLNVNQWLTVAKGATIGMGLSVGSNANISGSATISGNTTIAQNLYVQSSANITGALTSNGNLRTNQWLTVAKGATIGMGLSVGSNANVSGSVSASAFFYSSDKSLKKNIKTIPNALDKILQLRGVSFNWKQNDDGKENIGLVAQEVQEIFPEVVEKNEENGLLYLQYGNLVAPLVEAIKEQQKQIEELKTEIKK